MGLSEPLLADPVPPIVPTDPNEAFPHDTHIAPGDVYGVVEFSIPRWDVQKHKSFLKSLTSLGGSIFGKKNKEYILSIELSDTSKVGVDKLVSRAIIAHYVVDSRGKFTFNEKLLNNFGQTKWRGRLIDGIVVGHTNIMTISVNGYQATSSELHSGLIDSSTQLFTEASKYVGYAPLGESVKLVWTKVRDLATQLFNTVAPPESSMVISQSDMSFIVGDQGDDRAPKTLTFKVPRDLSNPGGAAVYVKIKLLTPRSVFASDGETVDGYFRFTRPRPDVYLNEANFNGKPILDLLKEDKVIGNFVANTIWPAAGSVDTILS